ncbi:MAG: alkaline phosphatase family protein [Chloroflexota bacterium]|jgi:hypothetical protein
MTLELPDEFTLPDYEGGSLANVPVTIGRLLGAPVGGLPPLRDALWRPLGGAKRVVLLLIDSLGWPIFQREMEAFEGLLPRAAVQDKITSVFPSTTVAALSCLWTGYAPAQHGLVGLRLLFPEQGVLGQMLKFSPNFGGRPGLLTDAGVDPQHFLAVPGLGQQLANHGVPSYTLKGRGILVSPLSEMLDRGVETRTGVLSSADLFVQLRELLESTAGQPAYIQAYWPAVDSICHAYGPNHPSVGAELRTLISQLQTELLDRLSPAARQDTLLFITGDHGQVETPPEQAVNLDDHPDFKELLLMRPAGEPRSPYLYLRQGHVPAAQAYLGEHWPEAMVAMLPDEALRSGLMGPRPHAPEAAGRLGDLMLTMRSGHTMLTGSEEAWSHRMRGRHGGMTATEMEMPWLGLRLDA